VVFYSSDVDVNVGKGDVRDFPTIMELTSKSLAFYLHLRWYSITPKPQLQPPAVSTSTTIPQ
jgi:hypothetical protein